MGMLISPSAVPTAAATLVVSAGVTAVYVFVGLRLSRRPVSPKTRLASAQFGLWWIGLGASVALSGVEVGLAMLNALPFPLAETLYLVSIIIDCAFLWGLVGALVYVYTGRYHLVELSVFYASFYVVVLYYVIAQAPYGVALIAGIPALEYSTPPIIALSVVVILGILAPEIGGAILYLSLLRRTTDRTQRFRISMVGTSILLWWALDVFVPSSTGSWVLARTILEVIPGVLTIVAILPPGWVQRRLHVTSAQGPDYDPREMLARP